MTVRDVEILQPKRGSTEAGRIVEVARDASVSLVEDEGVLEILARVPNGTQIPEDMLGAVAEILTWLNSHDGRDESCDEPPAAREASSPN